MVCVEREEERDKLEQEVETQCTQQNVTQVRGMAANGLKKEKGSYLNRQCFNDYETIYRDEVKEECVEDFIKTCRIVMRERSYNHSSLVCRRPLVKNCGGGGGYLAPGAPQPELVCETFYETECQPEDSGQVRCEQVQRKICAEENCREEEGEEVCEEELVENTVMVPEETCSLDPETVCRNVTVINNK